MTREERRYSVFGLTIESGIALPELLPCMADGAADVIITAGEAPRLPDEHPNGLTVAGSDALLNIPEAGRYWIEDGRKIVVEAAQGASDRNVRLYLLGSALGAILHQRGLLPLHANAVVIDEVAVAFAGHPGAGKSTLAGWFYDNGFPVLADDVCVVRPGAGGRLYAEPGLPRLRLWREALEASGRSPDGLELSFDDMDKYNVPLKAEDGVRARPLSRVYILEKAEAAGAEPQIRRLRGVEALDAIVANTYRGAYVPMMGATQRHLGQCVALVGEVPVFSVKRGWDLAALADNARAIARHASQPG